MSLIFLVWRNKCSVFGLLYEHIIFPASVRVSATNTKWYSQLLSKPRTPFHISKREYAILCKQRRRHSYVEAECYSYSACACNIYRVIRKSLQNFRTRLLNNQDRHSRVDISSTCKVGQKLGLSLPLLTCSPSAWPSRLLYHRGTISRRDLWITLYIIQQLNFVIYNPRHT